MASEGRHRHEWLDALPLGYYVDAHGQVQVANREAARMTLYEFDFLPCGALLNPHGQRQLVKIAALLPKTFASVTIETSGNPALDEARRLFVINALAGGPFPIVPERVVAGWPLENGLRGIEAYFTPDARQGVGPNLLQTASRGWGVGGAGTVSFTGLGTTGQTAPTSTGIGTTGAATPGQ
jgi:hypothetical protein